MYQESDYKYPVWVWVNFWIIISTSFIISPIGAMFQLVIFFLVKPYFTNWSIEIKGNPVKPFILISFFGLFGFVGYYLYYKSKTNRKEKLE